ncbi:acyl-CoA synthetase FdrA [Halomonas saccharevitans]|uniref:Succinyl-CoA synthetase, alpha subunit n=1 Tax=Halomonas saccharevitans TaxID=416872 RepID=A0A1I6ZQ67_9GAMM|nr:acyl-CoA synthetase FdrA [Halomonas saccharevitans]SFT64771.1 Succinyl-CoA synthetase, alpha subunit [Halomonas saccharevitans]
MATQHKVFKNLYQDSVSLMQVSSRLDQMDGIEGASVVMGTEANLVRIADAGFGESISAKPSDLVIAVQGDAAACDAAMVAAEQALAAKPDDSGDGVSTAQPVRSFALALEQHPQANLALISVPGEYAAAEAIKALNFGLNVMMFSDNVSIADERTIKHLAQEKNLMVMGPDCGTAIINGIPLGFANVVRRGAIGVVAASGTGLQEATCRIHQLGEGVSQALGTGGHDLHQDVGGLSMLHGLQALADDPQTDVVVLISKPPAQAIADKILARAASITKPVVVNFLGQGSPATVMDGVYFADSLAHSAEVAVALYRNQMEPAAQSCSQADSDTVSRLAAGLSDAQRYIRGVFAGGTFCYEAQIIAASYDLRASSNTPSKGNSELTDLWRSQGHTIVDLGDDAFTQGCPHPMIDPTLRNQRLLQEAQDPETAAVLFDLVLGYGAAEEPLTDLLTVIEQARQQTAPPVFIAHVCGTDADPQSRQQIQMALRDAGVQLADSNAHASHLAASLVASL